MFTRTAINRITAGRLFHRTTAQFTAAASGKGSEASNVTHNTDSYAKEVDDTPPADPQVHRVDASSENVQKPYEAPSGEWSRAGVRTSEYESVNKGNEPYAPKETEGTKLRYGGKKGWPEDKGKETSHPGEGPAGTDADGRKPEGR